MKKNRIASCKRKTKETDIELTINLDGVRLPRNQGYHKVRDRYGRSVDERRVWQQNPDRVCGSALRVHGDEVRNHS